MEMTRTSEVSRLRKRGKTKGPKPVCGKGYRNLFCSHYNQCLDFAIKKSWEGWACFKCAHKKQVMILDDFPATNSDMALYHELPTEFHLQAG